MGYMILIFHIKAPLCREARYSDFRPAAVEPDGVPQEDRQTLCIAVNLAGKPLIRHIHLAKADENFIRAIIKITCNQRFHCSTSACARGEAGPSSMQEAKPP